MELGSNHGIDGGVTPLPDAAVSPPVECDWAPGTVVQVTEPPSDKGLHAMAVSTGSVLLGWRTTNPDPPHDNHHYMQTVGFDGQSPSELAAIFPPPSGWSAGAMSIAAGPEHFGTTVWDNAAGCRFQKIDAGGEAVGSLRTVGPDRCTSLRSLPGGFSAFTHVGWPYERRLIQLDAEGGLVHTGGVIEAVSGGPYWWSSVRLGDGTYVVAGMPDEWEPWVIRTQHLDADGEPLGEPVEITELPTPANRVRLVAAGDSILAGWLASDGPDDGQLRYLTFQRLDLEGRPLGAPYRASDVIAYRDGGWSIVRHEDELLAVIVEPLDTSNGYGDPTALRVLPFTLEGEANGPALELAAVRFVRHPRIRSTPLGAVVGFTGMPEGSPHQIFTAFAECQPTVD